MTKYIKIKYQDEIYGSIRAPTTLSLLCSVLRISPRSSPTLVSIQDPKKVISSMESVVEYGFYELIHRRDIPFDPALDPTPHLFLKKKHLHLKSKMNGQEESQNDSQSTTLPIPEAEMDIAISAMLHIISSIPPRYIKYNVVLAHQVDKAISEVDRIHKLLLNLRSQPLDYIPSNNKSRSASLPIAIHTTFIQYRTLHLLYETWKLVWEKQSPVCRYFRISDVKTLESVEIAEHYLNRLNSWRRILEQETWDQLEHSIKLERESHVSFKSKPEPRIYQIPGLGSNKNPKAWTYLATPPKSIPNESAMNGIPTKVINETEALNAFRNMYIDGVMTHKLVKDEELNVLLNKMIELDKEFKSHSDESQVKLVYPSKVIRETIKKEFKLK